MSRKKKVLAIVLAGGEGKRLMPLTEDRAKPAGRRPTAVGMLASIYGEQFGALERGTVGGAKDTPYGQLLSVRVLAAQALEQAKVAATRKVAVDVSTIDFSKVQVPAPVVNVAPAVLSDADVDRIADVVAARLADVLAARLTA